MSQYARVNSVVMLKQLRSSLASFAETASTALDEVSTDIQRTLAWLNEDRRRYWKNQVRLRTERYVQAKLALKRKGMFDIALTGLRSTAVDEKKALAIAERQLQEAKRRLARTQSWILRIEKELSDYRAAVQGLSGALDLDIPNARARLAKMIESLEAYAALAPPETTASVDERPPDNIVLANDAQSTVFRPTSPLDAGQVVQALRETTPSPDIRDRTAVKPNAVAWVTGIRLSEGLRRAVRDGDFATSAPQPQEKVVLALPKDEPGVIYLERTNGGDGDSGWYVGVGPETESTGYVAVRIAELLQACPDLENILSLPTGHLILSDVQAKKQTLFDALDNLLWPNTDTNRTAPKQ